MSSKDLPDPVLPLGYPKKEASGATGEWAVYQPEIDFHKCNNCGICIMVCPEAAITIDPEDEERTPKIDYRVCKGCFLCRHECARKALDGIYGEK
ncbi:MAG: 4Fe-4S dicluster domain-containing protein [Candidatus Hodarchaeales archaeon]|jgi:pyruvate ferredoxin oxidoreductase delta subunit